MKTRGRPRHPELLTPRQQEVWQLLRQGLTNEEIADRLGISLDGAKYHVSEVLRRLGVDSRYEAAEFEPEAVATSRRARWAWVAAPLVAVKKLHVGLFGYAAAATVAVGGAAGIALLTWGIFRSGNPAPSAAALATATPISRTGIPEIDRDIELLLTRDIDSLTASVAFDSVGCSATPAVGSGPACPPGVAGSTPIDGFLVSQCEGTYLTTRDAIRGAIGSVLSRMPSVAVYAVAEDAPNDPFRFYTVAITEDRPSQATATVSFWTFAGSHLGRLQTECGPVGAAQQFAYRYSDWHRVLGAYNNCLERPGDTANYLVTVEGLSPGGIKPQFWGPAKTTLETDTGARAIVTVDGNTRWITADFNDRNALDHLVDVRTGGVLQAVGIMGDDCVITAQTILTPL
jgi:DNA-binding CsgD family transcriptional regulator